MERAEPNWVEIYDRLRRDESDTVAFTALQCQVARWARRELRSGARSRWIDQEDVVAETCGAAVVNISKARGAETFASFVYNHFRNARRRAIRSFREPSVSLQGIDIEEIELSDTPEDGPAPDERDLLIRCLDELPTRERRAVELRHRQFASAEEIAQSLSLTEGNARRVVHNALCRMRRCARQAWPAGRG